jgi:hypothetical protein
VGFGDRLEGFAPAGRFPDDLEVGFRLEQHAQARAHDGVIVNQE